MAQPTPSPTATAIAEKGLVITQRGVATRITPDRLRQISSDVASTLAETFGPAKLMELFSELTVATCVTNGGKVIPDNRTRLAAAIYLSNQVLGMPVQRTENVNVNADADSAVGMEDRLRHSPALRSLFRKMLDRVEEPAEV